MYRVYPMIKVEWLAAGLLFPSSAGLVTGQICRRRISISVQPMGSKGLLHWPKIARDMIKHTSVTQSSGSGFRINRKKYKNLYFSINGKSEIFKNLSRPWFRPRSSHACQLQSVSWSSPILRTFFWRLHKKGFTQRNLWIWTDVHYFIRRF